MASGFGAQPARELPKRPEIRYAAGDRVFHKAFGNGVVKQVAQTAGGARVTVDFGEGKGVKTFTGDAPMIKIG